MGFWENVNDELKKAVEEGWTVVKESAKTGKLRISIHNLNKRIEKHLAEIGGIVYDSSKLPWENPLSNPEVLKVIEAIKKIEAGKKDLEAELLKLKSKEAGAKP